MPGATLGLVGGGQLGRMFTSAARNLDYRVTVLDPDPLSPAAEFATGHLNTAYTHPISLDEMARTCAAITTEFENAPAETLIELARHTTVRPGGEAVAIAQDRSAEKGFFKSNGFPVGPFAVIRSSADIDAALREVSLPAVLKTIRFGYDGKGQARIATRVELESTLAAWNHAPSILEQFLPLRLEISVVLARAADGTTSLFPVAENQHVNGILDVTIAPARIPESLSREARDIAVRLAGKLQYVGVMAVEFFVVAGKDGEQQLLINEIAPRPHNSGHYTIDACRTSQFEQQVRVLCDLPLGDPSQHTPAVMLNLLGDIWRGEQLQEPPHWQAVLKHPGAHLHLYGKRSARAGRKMGHVTVCDSDLDRALAIALQIKDDLR
ncbi:MAG: 5-(carboxyamino)imidazole ribonucleotide synthase [Betaproteobacteria bacterium]|nr:5-(carboxyamino)imidazole ribonucleotide synthase [Betaproteobacteria bacterium]